MFRLRCLAIAALPVALCVVSAAATAAVDTDPLSAMFEWWNGNMRDHRPFDRQGFARHFTQDAVLTIDGVDVASGIDAVTRHFKGIQDSGAQVEIVLPFADRIVGKDRIYTYHVIRSRRSGVARCIVAAGHADLEQDRIRRISLVRSVIQPGSSQVAKSCWTDG